MRSTLFDTTPPASTVVTPPAPDTAPERDDAEESESELDYGEGTYNPSPIT